MNEKPVALVTGASRGIGRATALEFARRAYDVALLLRDADALDAVAEEARALGAAAMVLPCDLADLELAQQSVGQVSERFGRLDVLVNNAAWREITTMRAISLESWERTLRVCLTAPAFVARWAAEVMEPQRRGVIVNVSSIMSQQAAGNSPAYIACKGALDALTYELASLYGSVGIRVVAVNPGAVDTELSGDYVDEQGQSVTDELRGFSEDMIMLGRWAAPEEVARLIAALAGEDFAYVTGTTIVADGGWHRQHLPSSLRKKQFPEQLG